MFSEFPSLPTASHTVYFLLTLDNVSSIHLMQKEHSRSCRRIYASKQRRFFSADQQQVLKSLSHLLQLCSHFYVPMFIQSKLLVISGAFSPANRKMQTFLCHFSLDSRLNIKTFDWVYALSTSSFTCIIGFRQESFKWKAVDSLWLFEHRKPLCLWDVFDFARCLVPWWKSTLFSAHKLFPPNLVFRLKWWTIDSHFWYEQTEPIVWRRLLYGFQQILQSITVTHFFHRIGGDNMILRVIKVVSNVR